MLVVNHAPDQLAFLSHFPIPRQTEPLDPKAQTLLQIGTGDHWYAGFNRHRRPFAKTALLRSATLPRCAGYKTMRSRRRIRARSRATAEMTAAQRRWLQ